MSRGRGQIVSGSTPVARTRQATNASTKNRDEDLGLTFWASDPSVSYSEAREQGLLDRADGPAVEWDDGSVEFWSDGKLHRDPAEGPAVVLTDEADDEGAEELADLLGEYVGSGMSLYVVDGKLHREDGPAYTDSEGFVEGYYRHGKLDRDPTEGPALTWLYEDGDSSYRYAVNGKLHREDGPAVEQSNALGASSAAWFVDGKLHREDGPAVVVADEAMLTAEEVSDATGLDEIEGPVQMYYKNGKKLKVENDPEYEMEAGS